MDEEDEDDEEDEEDMIPFSEYIMYNAKLGAKFRQ